MIKGAGQSISWTVKEGDVMKSFLAAVLFAAVGAVIAASVLESQQTSASSAFTTSGARVGDPGYNLIGK